MSNSLCKVLPLQYAPSVWSQCFGVLSAAVTSSLPDINEAVHTFYFFYANYGFGEVMSQHHWINKQSICDINNIFKNINQLSDYYIVYRT